MQRRRSSKDGPDAANASAGSVNDRCRLYCAFACTTDMDINATAILGLLVILILSSAIAPLQIASVDAGERLLKRQESFKSAKNLEALGSAGVVSCFSNDRCLALI